MCGFRRLRVAVSRPGHPVIVMGLVAGTVRLATFARSERATPSLRLSAMAAAVVIVFILETFHVPKKTEAGFIRVASDILSRPDMQNAVILVSSQADGEGMLVAEIAMKEHRPGHYVLRATKALARIDWNATVQELYYATPTGVLGYLDEVPVGVLVLDLSPGRVVFEHQRIILETLAQFPSRFQLVQTYQSGAGLEPRGEIRLYRILGNENPAPGKVFIDRDRLLIRRIFWRG
jgi:hypothetical protein